MKIIFLGTPSFAVPTLERLKQSHHQILAVITQPDRPRERGLKITEPPVKLAASAHGIPVLQPEKASAPAVVEHLRGLGPDAAVVVAYGQILRPNFLSLPRYGCINLHGSLLPKYRGSSPIQAAILAGDKQTGVTTILMDEGLDTGAILLQQEVPITDEDTTGTLHDKLSEIGASLMVETLDKLERNEIAPTPQDSSKATLTRKITKKDSKIDWNRTSNEIFNQVRAFDPWPGCETLVAGTLLKIWKIVPLEKQEQAGKPGEVLATEGGDILVKTGDGVVRILRLQIAGGKRMSSADFLRGHPMRPGAVLGA